MASTPDTGKPEKPGIVVERQIDGASIPFVSDGLSAPTIYADAIMGGMLLPLTSKFNLVEHRLHAQENEMKAIHVATLVVPTSQVRAMAKFFTDLADTIDAAAPNWQAHGDKA